MVVKKKVDYFARFGFAISIVIAAILPYLFRCGHYFTHKKELPDFYQNEWDLFVFCIGIAIALMVENKGKITPFKVTIAVLFIALPIYGITESLQCEQQKITLEHEQLSCYPNNTQNIPLITHKLADYYEYKQLIFTASEILSVGLGITCIFLIVFKKSNK